MQYTYTESKQINLSSSSSIIINGSYNSQYLFNTNSFLNNDPDILYSQISLVNCVIPNSFYNVNYTNNILIINTVQYFPLTVGNYNANSFKTMLLNIIGSSYTISLNSATGIYTISSTSPFTINATSTCQKILGMNKNTDYSSVSNSVIMPNPCNFLGIQRLKIKSNLIKTDNYDTMSGGRASNLLATINVNASPGQIIMFQNLTGFKSMIHNLNIDMIDISITDENDNLINFNGTNMDIYITLQLDIIRTKIPDKENLHDIIQKQLQ